MRRFLNRAVVLLLAVILTVSVCPAALASRPGQGPAASRVLLGKPGKDDMKGCDKGVVTPDKGSWLSDYEYKVVQGTKKNSKGIILRQAPSEHYIRNEYNYLGVLYNGTEVTVLARQNGFSLVKVKPGQVGWVPSKGLVDKADSKSSSDKEKDKSKDRTEAGEGINDDGNPITAAPRLSGKPGKKDMDGCDKGVVTPDKGSWLSKYEYRVVQGTKKSSKGIILRQAPSDHYIRNEYNYLGVLYNGTEVAVLARQNGFSLVLVEPGHVGWVPSKGLVSK